MKYKVSHTTKYEYAETAPFCQNVIFLTPRNTSYQTCLRHRLSLRPQPVASHRRTDYFGNTVTVLSIDKAHRMLQITAKSTVDVNAPPLAPPATSPPWESVLPATWPQQKTAESLANYQFAFRSPHVPFHDFLADYARASFAPQRPILEALADLNGRIFADFTYDPKATNVSTPIKEVFQIRRGVCQDLAHLMLGGLRPLGLAARYVSGYLRTRPPQEQPRLTGADASHAWVSVYCGALGWIDVDPTNNVFPSTEHITIAWGRDYGDVCPVSGMVIGGGAHRLGVAVVVEPADA